MAMVGAALALALPLTTGSARGAERNWDEPAGGLFQDAANWSGGMAPGPVDVATFNLSAASPYTVSLGADTSVRGLDVGGDNVLFDLAGHTLNAAAKGGPPVRFG